MQLQLDAHTARFSYRWKGERRSVIGRGDQGRAIEWKRCGIISPIADAWAVPGPPEERKFIPRRNCDSSRCRPTLSLSLPRWRWRRFLWGWAPRGCIFSRIGFNGRADQAVIYASTSAIDFKFNRGYRPIMYPSRSNETRFKPGTSYGRGAGALGEDSAFFDRPMIGIPRVWLERVSVWDLWRSGVDLRRDE